MQQAKMKLHAKLSKFHIEHAQNGATVQHIHSKQDIATICTKQQLGILQVSKQYAAATQHESKRHGRDVQVTHNKTSILSYLHKSVEHTQKDVARLQIITDFTDLAEITGHGRKNIRLQSLELSNKMLQEHIIANKGMA